MTSALLGVKVRNAQLNEFPSVVALSAYYKNEPMDRQAICTGTFISDTHVLSSEHCLETIDNISFQILAESIDIRNAVAYLPCWWTSFDQWSIATNRDIQFTDNDIFIIKVNYY
jgi:V8-like Glu-specific endopeptidase